ncbi:hypothetical protein BKA93DRAFT_751971 [Sparassis latifolia]
MELEERGLRGPDQVDGEASTCHARRIPYRGEDTFDYVRIESARASSIVFKRAKELQLLLEGHGSSAGDLFNTMRQRDSLSNEACLGVLSSRMKGYFDSATVRECTDRSKLIRGWSAVDQIHLEKLRDGNDRQIRADTEKFVPFESNALGDLFQIEEVRRLAMLGEMHLQIQPPSHLWSMQPDSDTQANQPFDDSLTPTTPITPGENGHTMRG